MKEVGEDQGGVVSGRRYYTRLHRCENNEVTPE